ncbi:MAG TPA: hypothetical protein VFM55_07970 [Micromonosporaceae bacterium]|nr:hypothetical protein [Micromonosporaceae bacterium]
MADVELVLPPEVLAELDLPDQGTRGDGAPYRIVVEGLNVVASVVTLAALRPRLPALARALRRWVLRLDRPTPTRVLVHGQGIDVKLELPPNVPVTEILRALEALARAADEPAARPPRELNGS